MYDERQPLRQLQSPFLSLPIELIIEIASHLRGHNRDLCSLALACRLLQPICENLIYSAIQLRSTDELAAITLALHRAPRRIKAVRTLKILYKYKGGLAKTAEHRDVFNRCIKHMKNLREWHIESPFDNNNWEDVGSVDWVGKDMDTFRNAVDLSCIHNGGFPSADLGLPQLQKLTIHSHGVRTDFWELGGFECLFRHPALRYLHLSCVRFPLDLPELEPYSKTTSLETLIFDECELEPESLKCILRTPKWLKNLTLGENVHNTQRDRAYRPRLSTAPQAALQALLPVAHSLEALTHIDPMFGTLPDPAQPPAIHLQGGGMRDFHHLKYIDCDPCSFLHQGIILRRKLAPPNLEYLRLRHYSKQRLDFFDDLPNAEPYTCLPSLKELQLVQPVQIGHYAEVGRLSEYICNTERLRERHAFAYQLFKSGINTKVFAELQKKWSYIPPYLYGERIPEPVLVYDAEDVGFMQIPEEHTSDLQIGAIQSVSTPSQHVNPPLSIPRHGIELFQGAPIHTGFLSREDVSRVRRQVIRRLKAYCKSQGMRRPRARGAIVYEFGPDDEEVWEPMVGLTDIMFQDHLVMFDAVSDDESMADEDSILDALEGHHFSPHSDSDEVTAGGTDSEDEIDEDDIDDDDSDSEEDSVSEDSDSDSDSDSEESDSEEDSDDAIEGADDGDHVSEGGYADDMDMDDDDYIGGDDGGDLIIEV